jgi:hypothetical protein
MLLQLACHQLLQLLHQQPRLLLCLPTPSLSSTTTTTTTSSSSSSTPSRQHMVRLLQLLHSHASNEVGRSSCAISISCHVPICIAAGSLPVHPVSRLLLPWACANCLCPALSTLLLAMVHLLGCGSWSSGAPCCRPRTWLLCIVAVSPHYASTISSALALLNTLYAAPTAT